MNKEEALVEARLCAKETRRQHVVRENFGHYFACPRYELGRERYIHAALGMLVKKSLGAEVDEVVVRKS